MTGRWSGPTRRIGALFGLAPPDARAMPGGGSQAVPFHDDTSISAGPFPERRHATIGCPPATASATPPDAESTSSDGGGNGSHVVPSYWLTRICPTLDAVAKTGARFRAL